MILPLYYKGVKLGLLYKGKTLAEEDMWAWEGGIKKATRGNCSSSCQYIIQNLSVPERSRTGACSAERQCWCIWRAALKRSAVLKRPLKSTRACSVGENTIGDTLLRPVGVRRCRTWVWQIISCSSTGQNRWHLDDRHECLDRTGHYDHQWLLVCVPKSRRSGLQAPNR